MERILAVVIAVCLCLQPVAGIVSPASANGEVTLTVSVETPNEEPVDGAKLVVTWDGGSQNQTTAANGKAFVDVPEGANVTISVDHPQFVRNAPVEFSNATERDVGVTVYPRASPTIAIRDSNGAPVTDANVRLYKRGQVVANVRSDADGRVTTGVIETGEYRVRLAKSGFITRDITRHTDSEPWNLTMERAFVSVTFVTRDGYFSEARPISDVTIEGSTIGSLRTTDDGRRTVSVPVNTGFDVTVRKPGYQNVSRTVEISEESTEVEFTIRRTRAIQVRALSDRVVVGERVLIATENAYGDPVVDADVLLDGERVNRTDDAGEAIVRIDSTGQHTIQVRQGLVSSDPVNVSGIQPRTETPEPTATASPTQTSTATFTPTRTATPSATSSPTATATEETTASPTTEPGSGGLPGAPGFGIPAVFAAVVIAVLIRYRRAR